MNIWNDLVLSYKKTNLETIFTSLGIAGMPMCLHIGIPAPRQTRRFGMGKGKAIAPFSSYKNEV